jgi:hypothetical protein
MLKDSLGGIKGIESFKFKAFKFDTIFGIFF